MSPVGLITAMPAEAHALLDRLPNPDEPQHLPSGRALYFIVSGPGPARAATAAGKLLSRGIDLLLIAGVCGGCHPDLAPGHLVLADALIDQSTCAGAHVYCASGQHDRLARTLAAKGLPVRQGLVLSRAQNVCAAADKQRLHHETGALALDMESAAAARAAHAAGVPAIVLRAVCDPARRNLPPEVMALLTPDGQPAIGELVKRIMRKPGLIPDLLRLAMDYRAALKSLGKAWPVIAGEL